MKIRSKTLKNGLKSYYFRIVLNGKPTMKSGYISNKEAVNAYRAYKIAEAHGQLENQQVKRMRFNDLAKEWLAMKAKEVRPSTYKKIEERYRLHIQPYFKGIYLDELTPIKAQKFVNQQAAAFVRYDWTVGIVSQIFKKAVQYGYVKANPFANIDKPRAKKAPFRDTVQFYDVEELKRFLNSAYQLYDKDHYVDMLSFVCWPLRACEKARRWP